MMALSAASVQLPVLAPSPALSALILALAASPSNLAAPHLFGTDI